MGYNSQQKNWVEIGKVAVGERVSISDSSYFFDDPLIVALPPALYSVEVRYEEDNSARTIAAVRLAHGPSLRRTREVGRVTVDFAQIAICDRDQVEAEFEQLGNDGMPVYFDALQTTKLAYLLTLPQGTAIAITRTGAGDGEYPVFMLASADSLTAGIEVDFSS